MKTTTKTVIITSHKNVSGSLTMEPVNAGPVRGTIFTLVCAALGPNAIQMLVLEDVLAAAAEPAPDRERTRKLSASTKKARRAAKQGASVEEVAMLLRYGGHSEVKSKAAATVAEFGPANAVLPTNPLQPVPATTASISVSTVVAAEPVSIPVTNERGDVIAKSATADSLITALATPPCLECGKPTIPGVNSDFCSEECEKARAARKAKRGSKKAQAAAAKVADVVATVAGDSHVLPAGVRITPLGSVPAQEPKPVLSSAPVGLTVNAQAAAEAALSDDALVQKPLVLIDDVEGTTATVTAGAHVAKAEPTAAERKARAEAARARLAALKAGRAAAK
jgi:hypothetical protein